MARHYCTTHRIQYSSNECEYCEDDAKERQNAIDKAFAAHAAAHAEAKLASEALALPAIVLGSPKQIAWATGIRVGKVQASAELMAAVKDDKHPIMRDAKWWIDNRDRRNPLEQLTSLN